MNKKNKKKIVMLAMMAIILFVTTEIKAQGVPAANISITSMNVADNLITLTNTITITNLGDDNGDDTNLIVLLPFQVRVTQLSAGCTALPTLGTFINAQVHSRVVCNNFGSINTPSNGNNTRSIRIVTTRPAAATPKRFSAFVYSVAPDQDTTNNFRTVTIP
jgi:hypothetical protein